MNYIYVHDGVEINLIVSEVVGDTTYLTQDTTITIPADQVYEDLVNEISMSGLGYGQCYEIITDRYYTEHKQHYDDVIVKPLEDYHRIDLASYLEELRQDDLGNEDSPFYNNGVEWTPNRVSDL